MLANITLAMAAFAAASNHNPFQAPAPNITSPSALFRLSVPHGDFFFFNPVKFVPRSPIPTTNATNLTITDVNSAGSTMIATSTNIFATTHAATIPPAPTATSFTTTAPPAAITAPPFTAPRPAATTLPSPTTVPALSTARSVTPMPTPTTIPASRAVRSEPTIPAPALQDSGSGPARTVLPPRRIVPEEEVKFWHMVSLGFNIRAQYIKDNTSPAPKPVPRPVHVFSDDEAAFWGHAALGIDVQWSYMCSRPPVKETHTTHKTSRIVIVEWLVYGTAAITIAGTISLVVAIIVVAAKRILDPLFEDDSPAIGTTRTRTDFDVELPPSADCHAVLALKLDVDPRSGKITTIAASFSDTDGATICIGLHSAPAIGNTLGLAEACVQEPVAVTAAQGQEQGQGSNSLASSEQESQLLQLSQPREPEAEVEVSRTSPLACGLPVPPSISSPSGPEVLMTSEAIARATEIDAGFASTASLTETPVVPVGVTPSIPVPASPVLGPVLEPTVVDPAPSVSEPTHTSTTESALIADALTTIAPSAPRSSTTSTPKVTNDEREYPCCATGPPSGSRTPYFVLPEADAVPEVEEDTSGWTVVGRRRRPRAVDVKGKGRAPPELGVSA